MVAIGIIFLVLFVIFILMIVGSLGLIKDALTLMIKRQDEIIRILKNSKK